MASGYECGGHGESVVCGGEIASDISQEIVCENGIETACDRCPDKTTNKKERAAG